MAGHKWQKGVSGNPAGRPRMPDDLKKSCRRLAVLGMKELEAMITGRSKDGTPRITADADRLRAIKLMMEYGWGKPVQPVGGESEEGGIIVEIRRFAELDE